MTRTLTTWLRDRWQALLAAVAQRPMPDPECSCTWVKNGGGFGKHIAHRDLRCPYHGGTR